MADMADKHDTEVQAAPWTEPGRTPPTGGRLTVRIPQPDIT
ncbi:unknown [Prevotella sp. CAG:1058]|nr:unknown [Prevotella sp. CAG:1058]